MKKVNNANNNNLILKYKEKTASSQEIIEHLNRCANCFSPPLNTYVEINKYGKKIFDNAITFESWDGNKLVGLVAVYYNDNETKRGFITNVSVLKEYQGSGIASKLIKNAINFGRKNAFIKLMLEVNINNTKTLKLYKKHGFVVVGKSKNKIIMNKKNKMKKFPKPIYITRPIFPNLKEFTKKLNRVWESQWLSNNGPKHQLFESKIKEVLKVPYVSLFNNGTIALLTAIKALKLTGEVITTPFTFPATPHCISWNNLTPIFCDIDPITMNIDPDKIESLITKKTSAILAVHVFGTPCDTKKIQKIAEKHKLKVIYDAAHAFGVKINGVGIGNFGDVSMFSFHPTKLFHTAEGGALAFKDLKLKTKIELLKNFGIKSQEEVVDIGINGKMNEIQAVLGLLVLGKVDEEMKKRKLLLDTYHHYLKNIEGISFVKLAANIKKSYQYFTIRINEKEFGKSRNYVYEKFKKYNVFTRKYFYPLCSEYPHYKNLPSSRKTNLPVAHKVVKEVLSMPFYGGLYVSDVGKICNILKSFK